MTALLCLLTAALVAPFPQADADQAKKDLEKMQGRWKVVDGMQDGQRFAEGSTPLAQFVVKDDKYTVTAGKAVDRGTVKLKPTAKPKELDIISTDGPNKGKTILAIYERDGDTLRVCYDLSGKGRPREFKTTEGTQLFLVTYKREKP